MNTVMIADCSVHGTKTNECADIIIVFTLIMLAPVVFIIVFKALNGSIFLHL